MEFAHVVEMLVLDGPSVSSLTQFAREMRKNPTRAEAIFWRAVTRRQLGVRVRRQHVMPPYIVDFYIPSYRLVIEIDGDAHRGAIQYDESRSTQLVQRYEVRVLRFEAAAVERSVTEVIDAVLRECTSK